MAKSETPLTFDRAKAHAINWAAPEDGYVEAKWSAPGGWGLLDDDCASNCVFLWFDSLERLVAWVAKGGVAWYSQGTRPDYDPDAFVDQMADRLEKNPDLGKFMTWLVPRYYGQSELEWLGTYRELLQSTSRRCGQVRRSFRERQDKDWGKTRLTAPITSRERKAFAEWLSPG